jgi:inositol phosphorylceramide mannosyltransferase catalytic subunit
MIPSFDSIVQSSYAYNKAEYDAHASKWKTLQSLYENNYLNGRTGTQGIPKIIHQIWLGSNVPEKYQVFLDSWKKFHPDWTYNLWTDRDMISGKYFLMSDKEVALFDSIQNMGQKSDFLRYHLLNRFGGLYIDTDFECLKPFDMLDGIDFYTGIGYPAVPELYIGLIACTPAHPIIKHVVNSMTEIRQGGWRNIFETTGSYFFTRCFFDKVNESTDGVVAMPTDYFYPWGNNLMSDPNPEKYIKEWSYAIHHWAVSWSKKQ